MRNCDIEDCGNDEDKNSQQEEDEDQWEDIDEDAQKEWFVEKQLIAQNTYIN